MEFHQTAFTDTDTPAPFADSFLITFNITTDNITEGLEYFQARLVETSDFIRVRIGQQDTVNVTITDDNSESAVLYLMLMYRCYLQQAHLKCCVYLSKLL